MKETNACVTLQLKKTGVTQDRGRSECWSEGDVRGRNKSEGDLPWEREEGVRSAWEVRSEKWEGEIRVRDVHPIYVRFRVWFLLLQFL